MHEWQIKEVDQITLLGVESEFTRLQQGNYSELPQRSLIRIAYLIRAYKSLRILFSNDAQSNNWIHKPNKQFGENSALSVMLAGSLGELEIVTTYKSKSELVHMKYSQF